MTLVGGHAAENGSRRRAAIFAAFGAAQVLAAAFLGANIVTHVQDGSSQTYAFVETLVLLTLLASAALSGREMYAAQKLLGTQTRALDVASGALAEVVARQFEEWRLSPAEREVGHLALKGLDVAQIAAHRGAAPGTVRAQLARIYSKSGVSNRAQFAALFVQDLFSGPLAGVV